MSDYIILPCLFLIAAFVNVPLGLLRQRYEIFTFGWGFYSMLSIPVIVYIQAKTDFTVGAFSATLTGMVAGQAIGCCLDNRRQDSH